MITTVLDSSSDPMGAALQEYMKKGKASKLRVLSSLFDEDELPVPLLFREEKDMSDIERKALEPGGVCSMWEPVRVVIVWSCRTEGWKLLP